ncbi:hypothetical protein JCM8547_006342, partial [Rhodosporidiobolus lusitaniae]
CTVTKRVGVRARVLLWRHFRFGFGFGLWMAGEVLKMAQTGQANSLFGVVKSVSAKVAAPQHRDEIIDPPSYPG